LAKRLLIAIDGPSGAGKSTVAQKVAQRLGYSYIESGAMYRAVGLLALEANIPLDDAAALARLAAGAGMRFEWRPSGNRLLLDTPKGVRDVTDAIRSPEVTRAASMVSVHTPVRKVLVDRQRDLGRSGGVVMEGRDIGTKVFPEAEVKVFLDASLDARGNRRMQDKDAASLKNAAAVLAEMAERDRRDQERQESPLVAAPDAVRIDSTPLTVDHVVDRILNLVKEKQAGR
jgi:cytidylate kinase